MSPSGTHNGHANAMSLNVRTSAMSPNGDAHTNVPNGNANAMSRMGTQM